VILRIDVNVPQQNGQGAPRHRAKTDEQDPIRNVSIRYPRNHDKERWPSKTRHTKPIACRQPHDKHQQIV